MFLPLMRFRTADGASVCVAVVLLTCLNSFRLAGEHTEICFIGNSQLLCVFLGVNFMVKSGIAGLVVVDIVLIHKSFLSAKILTQNLMRCILHLRAESAILHMVDVWD